MGPVSHRDCYHEGSISILVRLIDVDLFDFKQESYDGPVSTLGCHYEGSLSIIVLFIDVDLFGFKQSVYDVFVSSRSCHYEGSISILALGLLTSISVDVKQESYDVSRIP